jgi:hypothetical protein
MVTGQKIITHVMMISMPSTASTPSSNARWLALVVVCFAQLMSIVDATIVNVALPSIQRSLAFTPSDLTWEAAPAT